MNTDGFIYEISDSTLMATGTLTITINGVNNGPILVGRIGNQSAVVNEMVNFSVGDDVFNDVDNDDSTLTYRITEKGLCTWLGITSTTGVFTGTPTEVPASNGRCEITVEVSDGAGGTSTDNFSLIVTAVPNVAPVAAADTNTVGENTASVSGNVITGHPTTMAGQDTDANAGQTPGVRDYAPGTDITMGNVGGVARVATGRYGTLTIAADGAYTYTVNAAANDSLVSATDTNEDVFTYEIGDGIARGVTATLTITITGVNDAPQAVSPAPTVKQGIIGAAYSLPLAQFFTDPDHATLAYGLSGTCDGFALNSAGTDLVGSESGDIPAATTAGDKTCMITATDNVVATPVSTSITIAVSATVPAGATNTPPTLTKTDTKVAVTEAGVDASNAAVAGDPAANGSLMRRLRTPEQTATLQGCADADASTACTGFRDATTAGLAITGVYGAFALMADGAWTYMLDNTDSDTNALAAGATATDTLRVRADDGVGNTTDMAGMGRSRHSTTLAVEVTVTGTNDRPTVANAIPSLMDATQGETFNYTVPQNTFTDVDDDDVGLTITVTQNDTDATNPPSLSYDTTTRQISGSVPANGTGRVAVSVNAGDGKGGMATAMFTLHLNAAPAPMMLTTAEDAGLLALNAAAFGYRGADDTRLRGLGLTITELPSAGMGRLLLNGQAVTPNQRIPIDGLASLTYEQANRKDDYTASFKYRIDDGVTPGTIRTFMVSVSAEDDAPEAVTKTAMVNGQNMTVMGIAPQNVNEGGSFSYTIQVGFEPTDDFNPVDTDDANLTFTAHIVDGNTETALRLPTDTGPDTATDWLRFDPATGLFSGTPPPDAASVMVRVRAKDARDDDRYSATSTFTLTVGGRPIFGIASMTHDDAANQVVITLRRENAVEQAVTVRVLVTAADEHGYIRAGGKPVDFVFADDADEVRRKVGLDRLLGPGGEVNAEIQAGQYDVSMTNGSLSATIMRNDKDVRNSTVKEGLGGLARALGWDLTDAISRRSSQVHRGGASQVDLGSLTQRLNSKLTDRLAGLGSSDRTTANNSNEIMAIINAMNDRSLAGQSASLATHTGGYGYIGTGSIGTGSIDTDMDGTSIGGMGIGGGNAGTIHTEAADARGWLIGLGSGKMTRTLDGIYGAMESGLTDRLPEDMNIWTDVSRSNIDFGTDTSFDGKTGGIRLGVEKAVSTGHTNLTAGLVFGTFFGDVDHRDAARRLSGKLDITGWSLNPYLLRSVGGSRVWLTLGMGQGSLNYSDTHTSATGTTWSDRDSSDLDIFMVAVGTEHDLMVSESMELQGRFEAMNLQLEADGGRLFDEQKAKSQGFKGELEAGWPIQTEAGNLRPYVTFGYRWDSGDGGLGIEYGTGVSMQMKHFTLDGSMRIQGAGDFERDSASLSFSYDHDGDSEGLMLALSQDQGVAEMDPFADYASGGFDSNGALGSNSQDRINVEVGYGFVLGSLFGESLQRNKSLQLDDKSNKTGMLIIHAKTDFNHGAQGRSEYGMTLETGIAPGSLVKPSRYELLFTRKPGYGTGAGEDAILLKLTRDF